MLKKIRTLFFIVALILSNNWVSGQENGLQSIKIIDSLFWGSFSSAEIDSFYFKLQPIKTSPFKNHIRISIVGQRIDFYSSDGILYNGVLTNYIMQFKQSKKKRRLGEPSKEKFYFFENVILDSILTNKMVEILFSSAQPEIPTSTSIPTWRGLFLHCQSIDYEFNLDGKYIVQSYHCPWAQGDSVQFSQIILSNYDTLKSIFKLDSQYNIFRTKLPLGCSYSKDGYLHEYFLTQKQSELSKKHKPQRDYLDSVKDTIISTIKLQIDRQRIVDLGIDCRSSYLLEFEKSGKIKKVSLLDKDKPRLIDLGLVDYIEEKRTLRKCKKKIKREFKRVDLRFLDIKYPFSRKLDYPYLGEIRLY